MKAKLWVFITALFFVLVSCDNTETVYYTKEPKKPPTCSKQLYIYVNEYIGNENNNPEARSCIILYQDIEMTMPFSGSSNGEKPLFTDKSYPGSPDLGTGGQMPNDLWVMVFVDVDGNGLDIQRIEEGESYHPDCPLYIPIGQYDCGETIEVYLNSFDDTYIW